MGMSTSMAMGDCDISDGCGGIGVSLRCAPGAVVRCAHRGEAQGDDDSNGEAEKMGPVQFQPDCRYGAGLMGSLCERGLEAGARYLDFGNSTPLC